MARQHVHPNATPDQDDLERRRRDLHRDLVASSSRLVELLESTSSRSPSRVTYGSKNLQLHSSGERELLFGSESDSSEDWLLGSVHAAARLRADLVLGHNRNQSSRRQLRELPRRSSAAER